MSGCGNKCVGRYRSSRVTTRGRTGGHCCVGRCIDRHEGFGSRDCLGITEIDTRRCDT